MAAPNRGLFSENVHAAQTHFQVIYVVVHTQINRHKLCSGVGHKAIWKTPSLARGLGFKVLKKAFHCTELQWFYGVMLCSTHILATGNSKIITKRVLKSSQECVWIGMSLTKKRYLLDVNQCPHQTTQYKLMMHYVQSGDKRIRGQLEYLAHKNAEIDSQHLRKLPVKKYSSVCVCVCARAPPLNSFYGHSQ